MRRWLSLVAVAALAAAGCEKKSPEGSAPGSPGSFEIKGPGPTTSTTVTGP